MKLTENEIEYRLRRVIERQLKAGSGHCQISVRRLGRTVYLRKSNGHFIEKPTVYQLQQIYQTASDLCEQYGGKVWTRTHNKRGSYNNASKVYQFESD